MTTLLISHPACLMHDMGEGHPEQPDRLRVINRAMERRFPISRSSARA